MRSWVWKYFDVIETTNGKMDKCKHCNSKYAHSSSTTNMSKHLKNKHLSIIEQD